MMKNFLGLALIFIQFSVHAITITEGTYRGVDHFIIYTKNATYYYDKYGGAFSRIVDKHGNDWISYKNKPWEKFPVSASSSFRGLPNLVNESEDHGVGHPGYKKCYTIKISKRTIRTTSLSGKWQWTWTFYKKHAELIIEKVNPENRYHFLYNGLIGGRFNPENQYYGTNLGGPRFDIFNLNEGEKLYGSWYWAYFGDRDVKRVFFVAMHTQDIHLDSYAYLGEKEKLSDSDDGLVSFGFGTKEQFEPLMNEKSNHFYIGIIERRIEKSKDHLRVQKLIENIIN